MPTTNAHLEDHVYPDGYGRTHLDKPFWTVRCDNHEGGAWVLNSGHHYTNRADALDTADVHDKVHHPADVASAELAHDCADGDHWPCTAVAAARAEAVTA